MQQNLRYSPCLSCTSVRDPGNCENKNCVRWRNWFIRRWDTIRCYPRMEMEQKQPTLDGVNIGGISYMLPHRLREYLQKDPCSSCVCPKDLCSTPCPTKRAWLTSRNEVIQ